jgi:hypothetical protein
MVEKLDFLESLTLSLSLKGFNRNPLLIGKLILTRRAGIQLISTSIFLHSVLPIPYVLSNCKELVLREDTELA